MRQANPSRANPTQPEPSQPNPTQAALHCAAPRRRTTLPTVASCIVLCCTERVALHCAHSVDDSKATHSEGVYRGTAGDKLRLWLTNALLWQTARRYHCEAYRPQVLEAYAVYRADIGYVQGMSYYAAHFLLCAPPPALRCAQCHRVH